MKKVALVLIAIVFVAGMAFAQDSTAPVNKMVSTTTTTTTTTNTTGEKRPSMP